MKQKYVLYLVRLVCCYTYIFVVIFRSGSEQLRLQMSKKLLDDCKQSRDAQIQYSKHQQQSLTEAENSDIKEARRFLLEEVHLLPPINFTENHIEI